MNNLARVTQGAYFLDRTCPGWYKRGSSSALDIGCPVNCALAQEYGSWEAALKVVGLTEAQLQEMGVLAVNEDEVERELEYDDLTHYWRLERQRRTNEEYLRLESEGKANLAEGDVPIFWDYAEAA